MVYPFLSGCCFLNGAQQLYCGLKWRRTFKVAANYKGTNMSKLSEYKSVQSQIAEMTKNLAALESDPQLVREMELEKKLRELMEEYGKSASDVIALLDPKAGQSAKVQSRKTRRVKRYVNPNTNEVIETRGGNHKKLKEWKDQYGADVVEEWQSYDS